MLFAQLTNSLLINRYLLDCLSVNASVERKQQQAGMFVNVEQVPIESMRKDIPFGISPKTLFNALIAVNLFGLFRDFVLKTL